MHRRPRVKVGWWWRLERRSLWEDDGNRGLRDSAFNSLTYSASVDYDQLDRAIKIRDPSASSGGANSGIGVLASYAYTPDGKRSQVTYGNGTARLYQYDAAGRTIGVKLDLAGTANDLVIGQVAAEGAPVLYNPAGQIVSLARSNDAYAWTAHALFERDYTVNGLNQLTSATPVGQATTAFTFDARGNLTGSGTSTYSYDSENRLTGGPNGAALEYDSLGRMAQRTGNGTNFQYAYDAGSGSGAGGDRLLIEYNLSNSVVRRFVHGPGTDEPILFYKNGLTLAEGRRFLMADERGSIINLADSGGTSYGIAAYDEYGIPKAVVSAFGYTGQVWLSSLGMWYYKARI